MPADTTTPATPSTSAPPATTSVEELIERALARQTLKIEEVVRAQLNPHTIRLEEICARLTVLEGRSVPDPVDVSVATGGDTSSSSIPTTTSVSTAHIVEAPQVPLPSSIPTAAPSQLPSRFRDSAREAWDGMTSSERSAWRAYHAGIGQQAPPPPAAQPPIPASAPPSSGRPLQCKPELLPKFDGDPRKLEVWISRVRDLVRTNRDPLWDPAVVAVIPNALTGAAARWHAALSDEQIDQHRAVADIFAALRRAFPINHNQARMDAHNRKWRPRSETAMMYAYDKLTMLRTAYGPTAPDELTLSLIIDGLDDSMKPMVRLAASHQNMDDLAHELCEWEPVWRAIHKVKLEESDTEASSASKDTDKPFSSSSKSARPPPSSAVSKPAGERRPPPTLGRYDPSRVIEATATEKRQYRREDGSVMRLNRPCGRCGEEHFDFEHSHLKDGARSFPMVTLADYELDEVTVSNESDF
ncbi:hypothetical protein A4X13_0g7797 [Tilletia indica]|uniref:Retrotransposon gag domain-containing protein n=1 Tax=Tilletia indica TaxID=43049 RepID=A0A177T4Q1_9BASI|nr:hypothetical protein A4X13_0g7797 [Tilletia indica]